MPLEKEVLRKALGPAGGPMPQTPHPHLTNDRCAWFRRGVTRAGADGKGPAGESRRALGIRESEIDVTGGQYLVNADGET